MTTYGFVGLGNMGAPMVEHLIEAGLDVLVFDALEASMEPFKGRAKIAASLEEMGAQADVVFLSLPTPPIVEKVCLGEGGFHQASRTKIIFDLSTTGSKMAASIQEQLASSDIVMMDAPVSGGTGGAKKGTLAVMISGPKKYFDEHHKALSCFGTPFYVGNQPGLAQTMKLANNILSAASMAVTSEVMAFGVRAGLNPDVMLSIINSGTGRNTATADKFPRGVVNRSFGFGFAAGLMTKDARLFGEEARAQDMNLPVAEAVIATWNRMVDEIGAEADFTQVVQLMEGDYDLVVSSDSNPVKED